MFLRYKNAMWYHLPAFVMGACQVTWHVRSSVNNCEGATYKNQDFKNSYLVLGIINTQITTPTFFFTPTRYFLLFFLVSIMSTLVNMTNQSQTVVPMTLLSSVNSTSGLFDQSWYQYCSRHADEPSTLINHDINIVQDMMNHQPWSNIISILFKTW